MDIPDNQKSSLNLEGQKLALFWQDRAIGLMESKIALGITGIYTLVWSGTCLGEEEKAGSLGDAMNKMTSMARKKGIYQVHCVNGAEVGTLYTPAFEE